MIDFEAKVEELYQRVLRPGDTCVDVGAHAGRHMFPMAKCVSPGGRVFGFEPVPSLFETLQAELAKHAFESTIELFRFAASETDGESEFVVALDVPGYSGLKERTYDVPTRLERIRVQTRTLDGVLGHLDEIRFIKIDVEGGEWGVIQGATRLIERCRPVLGFEFGLNSYEKYGVDPGAVFDFFASRDFLVVDILGRPMQTRQQFVDSSKTQSVWDYAALPSESWPSAALLFPG